MKLKRIFLLIFTILAFSNIAIAAPLTDFQLGKFAVDVDFWRGTSFVQSDDYLDLSQNGYNAGVTVALNNTVAVRYRYNQMAFGERGMSYQDINALYRINFIYEIIDRYIYRKMNDNVSANATSQEYSEQQAANIIQDLQRENLFGIIAGVSRVDYSSFGSDQYSYMVGYITSLRFLHTMSVYSELSIGNNMQIVSDSGFAWHPADWMDVNIGYRGVSFVFEGTSQYVSKSGYYGGLTIKG